MDISLELFQKCGNLVHWVALSYRTVFLKNVFQKQNKNENGTSGMTVGFEVGFYLCDFQVFERVA
jgi:hypothetical protein